MGEVIGSDGGLGDKAAIGQAKRAGIADRAIPAGWLFRVYWVCFGGDRRTVPLSPLHAHWQHIE